MFVIIDLQEGYWDEFTKRRKLFEETIKRITKQILAIKKRGEHVIALTTPDDGLIIPEISAAMGTKGKTLIHKRRLDGSEELVSFMEKENIREPIELAGAFRDVCVLETWKGLKRKNAQVLPVDPLLTIETKEKWRKIKYPRGYLL